MASVKHANILEDGVTEILQRSKLNIERLDLLMRNQVAVNNMGTCACFNALSSCTAVIIHVEAVIWVLAP